jgi:hypothetical protein
VLLGFLRGQVVPAGGFALSHRRTLVGGDVAEALLDCEFLNFGGTLMGGAGLIVAVPLPAVGLCVTLMGKLGLLRGAFHVVRGDGLPRGKLPSPTVELVGTLGGFVTS